MTNITERLHHRLFEPDKANVRKALLEYMLANDLKGEEVDNDEYLARELLPYLTRLSPVWIGLDKNIEWIGSTAYAHLQEYLKNQLRNKGLYINRKIADAKALEQSYESEGTANFNPPVKAPARKIKLGKRAKPDEDNSDPEPSQSNGTPQKILKVEEPDKEAQPEQQEATAKKVPSPTEQEIIDAAELFR